MPGKVIRIATRASPLALAQAEEVRTALARAHGLGAADFEILALRTTGDGILDRTLTEAGGKGLFTKEIEEALLDGRADIAVHSAKDLPADLPAGLGLVAALERADVRDAFISPVAPSLEALPACSVVGTASLRRAALVRRARPDLSVAPLRGNVQTRLAKLAAGEFDATLLAMAGLNRLGRSAEATRPLDSDAFPPALAQGIIAIEARVDDEAARALCAAIDHTPSAAELACERAFLARLDGSCRTPIAGLARAAAGRLSFHGLVISPDGTTVFEARRVGTVDTATELGTDAADEIVARAGDAFLAGLRGG